MAFHQPPDCTFSEIYYKVCNQAGDNGGIEKNPAPIYLLQNPKTTNLHIEKKKIPPPQIFFWAKSIEQQYYLVWPYNTFCITVLVHI